MLKLLAGYFYEREGFSVLGNEKGFVTYKDQGDLSFYIRDLYVHPDFRKTKIASILADEVVTLAKSAGAIKLVGTVADNDPNRDRNIKVLHGYGMTYGGFNKTLNSLVFEKEI